MTVLAYQRTGDLQKVAQQLITNLASSGAAGTGADAVGYTPPGAGAVATTVGAFLGNFIVFDVSRGADPTGTNDNRTALQAAVTYCKSIGAQLLIPPGNYKLDTTGGSVTLEYVTLMGSWSLNGSASPASTGSIFSIVGTANPAFLMRRGVTLDGIGFYYPNQVDSATPTAYAPTIQVDISDGAVQFCYIQNCVVYNSYRFFVDTDSTGAIGHVEFNNNVIYGILTCYEVAYNSEVIKWQGNNHTFGHFLAATEGGLRGYTRANGTVLKMPKTDGFFWTNNLSFGYLNGIYFDTSATLCQLFNIESSFFDQVRFGILIDGTGNVAGGQIVGNSFVAYNPQNTALIGNAIKITTSGAVATETLTIDGNNFSTCTGDEILVSGTPLRLYSIGGNQFNTWAAFQGSGSYAGINVSGASTNYTAAHNVFLGPGTNFGSGVIGSPSTCGLVGNTFLLCYNAVAVTSNDFTSSNNMSFNTGGAASDVIGATNQYQSNNVWDKPSNKTTNMIYPPTALGNYANDGAAAASGVSVGGYYRNGSVLQIRVT